MCAELSVSLGIWGITRTSEYWGDFLKVDTIGTEVVPCVPVSSGFQGPNGAQAAGEKSLGMRCLQVGAVRARW